MHAEGCKLPNTTHPEVPIGPEDKATLLKLVGSKPKFDFTSKDHIELGK
jgi:seryl-tRNA synthetase